jgi:hypothetical protein
VPLASTSGWRSSRFPGYQALVAACQPSRTAPYVTTYPCAGEQCLLLATSKLLAACPSGDQPITYLCAGEQVGMEAPSGDQRLPAVCPLGEITYLCARQRPHDNEWHDKGTLSCAFYRAHDEPLCRASKTVHGKKGSLSSHGKQIFGN